MSAPPAPAPAASSGAVEALMRESEALSGIEASIEAAAAAKDADFLRGLAVRCGELMTRLDSIDCGPRGSAARDLRKDILVRAEAAASTADAYSASL